MLEVQNKKNRVGISGKRMMVSSIRRLPEVRQKPELSLQEYDTITLKILHKLLEKRQGSINSYSINRILKDQDLLSYLTECLMWADSTYNPECGASLRTWRYKRVLFGIKYIARHAKHIDANVRDNRTDLILPYVQTKNYTSSLDTTDEIQHIVYKACLNERHVKCLQLRCQNYTFQEIGDTLLVSSQRAQQIYHHCISELKKVTDAN